MTVFLYYYMRMMLDCKKDNNKKKKTVGARWQLGCDSLHLSSLLSLLVVNVSFLYMTVLSGRKSAKNKRNQRQHKTWMTLNEAAGSQICLFLKFHTRYHTKNKQILKSLSGWFRLLSASSSLTQQNHHHVMEPAFQEAGCCPVPCLLTTYRVLTSSRSYWKFQSKKKKKN